MSKDEELFEEFDEIDFPDNPKVEQNLDELEAVNPYKPGPLVSHKTFEEIAEQKPLTEQLEGDLEVISEKVTHDSNVVEVQKVVKAEPIKPKTTVKAGKDKVVSSVQSEDIKKLQKENIDLKTKLAGLEAKDIVQVDAQNTDDMKKIIDLMREGRFIVDTKNKPFILSEYRDAITVPDRPIIHRVYCEDITCVTANRYYKDLENVDENNRELIKEVFWVHHKGYYGIDMITKEQLTYLLENGFITEREVKFTFVDKMNGIAYDVKTNEIPTLEDILKQKKEKIAKWESAHPKKGSKTPLNDDEQVVQVDEVD